MKGLREKNKIRGKVVGQKTQGLLKSMDVLVPTLGQKFVQLVCVLGFPKLLEKAPHYFPLFQHITKQ